jgi:hypothetical protein
VLLLCCSLECPADYAPEGSIDIGLLPVLVEGVCVLREIRGVFHNVWVGKQTASGDPNDV